MTQYLIMKCDPLGDQWECDADRTPMFITNDWENNRPTDYRYEVYEIKADGTFDCIREYYEHDEKGFAFTVVNGRKTVIIKKWPNGVFNSEEHWSFIRPFLEKYLEFPDDVLNEDEFEECFYWFDESDNRMFIYGQYWDDKTYVPW